MSQLDWDTVFRAPRRKVALLLAALVFFILSATTSGVASTALMLLGTLCVLGALVLLAKTYGLMRE